MSERKEALMRILVGIISGIIWAFWGFLMRVIVIIHFLYVLFANKRNKDLAEFSNSWNTFTYNFMRYMTFTTNKRPFPFTNLGKNKDPVQ